MKDINLSTNILDWCGKMLAETDHLLTGVTPLRVEASHRRFYRLHTQRQSAATKETSAQNFVLMDSPPDLEQNEQFATLAEVFHTQGLPVPCIVAKHPELGLFLLTDLGDIHLEDSYQTSTRDTALKAAIDALPILAATNNPAIEPYSRERLEMEMDIFLQWFVQEFLDNTIDTSEFASMAELLVSTAEMQPKGCVHRDYHCRNLLFNHGKLGIVDFQDALYGPILYDIASLLRDCYWTFDEQTVDQWLSYFVSVSPTLEGYSATQIKLWFDWIAIQRQLKAVGIFARLHLRDQKSSHLEHILPVLARLERLTSTYSELAPLNMQLNSCISAATPLLKQTT